MTDNVGQAPFLENIQTQRDAPLSSDISNDYVQPDTLSKTLKSWIIWSYFIYACLVALSLSVTMIAIPVAGRKYFNENNNDCSLSFTTYTVWSSLSMSASGITALFTQSYIGRLSDAYGRKRILIFVLFCTIIPIIPLCFTSSIWIYFVLRPIWALSGMNDAMPTVFQASISDLILPKYRTTIFSIIFGLAGIMIIIGAILVELIESYYGIKYTFYFYIFVQLIALIWLIFGMKETLIISNRKALNDDFRSLFDNYKNDDYLRSQRIELNKIGLDIDGDNINIQQYDILHENEHNVTLKMKCINCCKSQYNPLRPLYFLRVNNIIYWMSMIVVLISFSETGLNNMLITYCGNTLNLCDDNSNTRNNSYLIISQAILMILSQLILLPIISQFFNDIALIYIAITLLLLTMLFSILLYFIPNIYFGLIIFGFHGMSFASIPIINGALSKRLSTKEQGLGMGIIHSIKGLNLAISPLIFAFCYWFFTNHVQSIPFLTTMPLIIGSIIVFCAYPITFSPLKRVFQKYDEYAFRASIVPFDDDEPITIPPPQQLL